MKLKNQRVKEGETSGVSLLTSGPKVGYTSDEEIKINMINNVCMDISDINSNSGKNIDISYIINNSEKNIEIPTKIIESMNISFSNFRI